MRPNCFPCCFRLTAGSTFVRGCEVRWPESRQANVIACSAGVVGCAAACSRTWCSRIGCRGKPRPRLERGRAGRQKRCVGGACGRERAGDRPQQRARFEVVGCRTAGAERRIGLARLRCHARALLSGRPRAKKSLHRDDFRRGGAAPWCGIWVAIRGDSPAWRRERPTVSSRSTPIRPASTICTNRCGRRETAE